jgi:phytanoyl-CoA hydroxylase
MEIKNSVVGQARPWHMDESIPGERLSALPEDVRRHVAEIIEDGFTIIRGAITRQQCVDLIQQFKDFAAINNDKFGKYLDSHGHYPRIVNLHAAMPQLFQIFAKNSLALRVQEALFNAPPCLYTSLFYERGSAQPLHRDTPVFSTKPEYFYFGVWTALEDANEINGALEVMPGGHKLPELDRSALASEFFATPEEISDFSQPLWNRYQNAVAAQCEAAGLSKKMLNVQAGDTVIWHPQLPHGGGKIADISKSRFSIVMHTTPIGVPVYHQDKFFHPGNDADIHAHWRYEQLDGAYRVIHNEVNFAHQESFSAADFKQPVVRAEEVSTSSPPSFMQRILQRSRNS